MENKSQTTTSLTQLSEITSASTAIQLVVSNKPVLISNFASNLTIEKAVSGKYHLGYLRKHNEVIVITYVSYILKEFLQCVLHNINEDTIVYYANLIVDDYKYWKPEDVILCLKNGLKGKYKSPLGRFTYQTFTEWANQYDHERMDYFEKEEANKTGIIKQEELKIFGNERNSGLTKIEQLIKKFRNEKHLQTKT